MSYGYFLPPINLYVYTAAIPARKNYMLLRYLDKYRGSSVDTYFERP